MPWYSKTLWKLLAVDDEVEADDDNVVLAEIAITNACNLECIHCSRLSLSKKQQEITKEVLFRFLIQLEKQGGQTVCFTGGEPLAKKAVLYPAVEYTASLGMAPTIITNGLLLNREAIAELKKRGISAIGVSLNGTQAYHDHFVARQGAYAKSLQAVVDVVEAGIACNITCVPTDESMADGNFQHILDLATQLGVETYINFPTLAGAFKDSDSMLLSPDNVERIYELGRKSIILKDVIRRGNERRCPVPQQLYISPWGDVCPCPFIQLSFGNIFELSLSEIKEHIRRSGYLDKVYECCPPAEDKEFIEKVIKPIYDEESIPVHYSDHPHFSKSCRVSELRH